MTKETGKQAVRRIYTLLSLMIAFVSAALLWYTNVGPYWDEGFFGTRTLFIVGMLFCVTYWFFSKMYRAHKIGVYRLWELFFSQMLAFAMADVCLFVAAFFWFHDFTRVRLLYYLAGLVGQSITAGFVIFISNRAYARFDEPRRIVFIYGSEDYEGPLSRFRKLWYRYTVLGVYPETEPRENLYKAIDACQDVYLYDVSPGLREEVRKYCEQKGLDIHMTLSIEEILMREYDVSAYFDTPYLKNRGMEVAWYYPFVKRFMDIAVSLIVLVALSPFMLAVACAIRLYDHGPALYSQVRLTEGGREFRIYKFRSMIVNAEAAKGAQLAEKNDSRITPVGRFIRATRMDELPQFLNILKGDMSLVGPRPERPELAAEFEKELPEFRLRLRVKAGLTGYAQVYGKYNTSPKDKLKMDLLYITKRSFLYDLKLIFYTMKIVFIPDSTEGV